MRHGKKINHLNRKSSHRKAMLSNLANSLITHKRIKTTLPKAKALRKWVEPIITRAKYDNTHSRRMAFSDLGDKEAVKELFITVADKVGDRPGGYTRIIKLGSRLGDNAEMAMIELVDFNENLLEEKAKSGRKRKRRRRGGSKKSASEEQKAGEEVTGTATEGEGQDSSGKETAAASESQEESADGTDHHQEATDQHENQTNEEPSPTEEAQTGEEDQSEEQPGDNDQGHDESDKDQKEGGDETDTNKE